jgi:8-oxo-dGTP diphosphatase
MAKSSKRSFTYDFPRPALTVDLVLVTLEVKPRLLLIRRKHEPFAGKWALPGGFVDEGEDLLPAALRELKEEAGVEDVELEQLHTFGTPGRDPRGWTVSVVYFGRVDGTTLKSAAGDDAAEVGWFPFSESPPLAFDHDRIVDRARIRLADRAP